MSWKKNTPPASDPDPADQSISDSNSLPTSPPTIAQEKPIFRNNTDWHHYLLSLRDVLTARGAHELAAKVEWASEFVWGSSSTEFFGEAWESLEKVTQSPQPILEPQELASVKYVIRLIADKFRRANSGQ